MDAPAAALARSSGVHGVYVTNALAAGQAATMTATFAGQFVMEGFLDIKVYH